MIFWPWVLAATLFNCGTLTLALWYVDWRSPRSARKLFPSVLTAISWPQASTAAVRTRAKACKSGTCELETSRESLPQPLG